MIKLSVVVITYNEAANIGRCIDSLRGVADEVLVVDSFSTDETAELARQRGARVLQRAWSGYTAQREYAAGAAAHDYVLALDADEYLSDALRHSIESAKTQWTHDVYTCNRFNRIGDRWVRHGSWYPDRKLRLFDRRRVSFRGSGGHDAVVPNPGATLRHLPGDLLHHANRDIHDRIDKINKLSLDSARYLATRGKRGSYLRLLFKPFFRFLIEYILRRGFLDGFYGFVVAVSSAQYVFLREAKLMEMEIRNGGMVE